MAENRRKRRAPPGGAKSGYERIAFGGVNDAVRLLFEDDPDPESLRDLDLYNVAEMKRVKGGVEIRFYDRMKALECLRELEEKGAESSPLYLALKECAQVFEKEKDREA